MYNPRCANCEEDDQVNGKIFCSDECEKQYERKLARARRKKTKFHI